MSHNKLSKHELKDDPFVTFMLETWEFVRAHQNKFFAGLVVLVVIIAGAVWMNNSRMQARETAAAQFSEAMDSFRSGQIRTAEEMFTIVRERFGNLEEGINASFFLGRCALLEGRNTEAIGHFEDYIERSGGKAIFIDAAREGVAVAHENERDFAKAAELYAALAEDLRVNGFMKTTYLRRAADDYKLASDRAKAAEILERIVDEVSGREKREIEVELKLLRG